jgi:hypothetical protein
MARRDTAANHWALNLLEPTILRQTQNLWEQPEVTRGAKAAGGSTSKTLTWHRKHRCRRDLRRLPQG